jgi:predicted phage terminase large subunit-like protein
MTKLTLPRPIRDRVTDAGKYRLQWSKYIPHEPHAKQLAFCMTDSVREVLFGGAAGGGKSDGLLQASLQYVNEPTYSAILFRRTYSDLALEGALIPLAHEWLGGTDARWHDGRKRWTFPSGATLQFGYLDSANDKFRYQSASFQYIGFDELTQFDEHNYRYLFSRLRRRKDQSHIPLRMRAASNPGGRGHTWVKNRFVDTRRRGRMFIKSLISDNPSLDRLEYEQALNELDPVTRAQLMDGNWTVRRDGMLFKREWFKIIDEVPKEDGIQWVRFWDLASTEPTEGVDPDWTVGMLIGRRPNGSYIIAHIQRFRASPNRSDELMKQRALIDGPYVAQRVEEEGGSSGKRVTDALRRTVFDGYNFDGIRPTGSKVDRARPTSSAAEAGLFYLVKGHWVDEFLEEVEGFPLDAHDDQVDTLSGGHAHLAGVGQGVPLAT